MGIYKANGHIGTDGHWGRWALGANGHWGKIATRKNEHQSKWAFMRQMGIVEQMGTLGSMDFGAIRGHWGKIGIGGKWPPGKMSTTANGHLGQMGTLGQIGIWDK